MICVETLSNALLFDGIDDKGKQHSYFEMYIINDKGIYYKESGENFKKILNEYYEKNIDRLRVDILRKKDNERKEKEKQIII